MRLANPFAVAAAACALAAAAPAQTPDVTVHGPAKAVSELIAVERAFAVPVHGGRRGRTAFAEYLDPADSRAFMGGEPMRGAVAIGAAHAGPGQLNWQPKEVFAAKGGDMGVVWGVFQFTLPKGAAVAGQSVITGRYVTAWRKDARGAWKGIIDIGTPDQK